MSENLEKSGPVDEPSAVNQPEKAMEMNYLNLAPTLPETSQKLPVLPLGLELEETSVSVQPGTVTAAADASIPETETTSSAEVATEETQVAETRRRKSFWREVLETVILTILIFFLVKALIQNFQIVGASMEPSFHTNQRVLVNKAAYFHFDANAWLRIVPGVKAEGTNVVWLAGGPHRGDVLVLEPPDVPQEDYIKRLIALPGETVQVKDGIVYINDKPLKEDYIKDKPYSPYGPAVVPPNNFFVMGDNRNGSRDSRVFGFLPIDKVVGKAMFVYWPFGPQWGIVPEAKYN